MSTSNYPAALAREADTFACEQAGYLAGKQGKPFSDCPYLFAKLGVSQGLFDSEYRRDLNAWSRGWRKAQKDVPN